MSGVADKIAKLLAMAEHPNSNPNEAAMAASRAAMLAAEHNLDLEELRARGAAPKKQFGKFYSGLRVKKADIDAMGFLMTGCGRLYGAAPCFVTGHPSTVGLYFAGQQHNAELAIKWVEYLWECCKRANTEHARQSRYGSSKVREEARKAFRYAFGVAVLNRMMEKHREMTKPPVESDSRALAIAHQVVTEFNEAKAFLDEDKNLKPVITKQTAMLTRAFRAGAEAGKKASLHDQVGRG